MTDQEPTRIKRSGQTSKRPTAIVVNDHPRGRTDFALLVAIQMQKTKDDR